MKADQEEIYYMTGENRQTIENSPHMEAFKEKGYEVLLLTDPVDELWVEPVGAFEGKSFRSVGKGDVELGSEDEKKAAEEAREEKEKEYHDLLDALKGQLSEYVKEVRLSGRLTQSASCLVGGASDMTPHMEQLLKSMNQEVPKKQADSGVKPLPPHHVQTPKPVFRPKRIRPCVKGLRLSPLRPGPSRRRQPTSRTRQIQQTDWRTHGAFDSLKGVFGA